MTAQLKAAEKRRTLMRSKYTELSEKKVKYISKISD